MTSLEKGPSKPPFWLKSFDRFKTVDDFVLEPLSDLLSEAEEEHEWSVDQLLPVSGLSMCVGKPKAGKTTLIRQLALAVATGQPFLGFSTVPSLVLYLALEEKRTEVRKHFRQMGADGSVRILIHAAGSPTNPLKKLESLMKRHEPGLIIIDPLFRFTEIRHGNEYSEVSNALAPLVNLARSARTHILLVHHAGKTLREGADGILGSTALFGAIDTAILLSRNGAERSIATDQRYGKNLEKSSLLFNTERREMTLGTIISPKTDAVSSQKILSALEDIEGGATQNEILNHVGLRKDTVIEILDALTESGKVFRSGSGKKGKPFVYSLPDSSVSVAHPT